jgi:hypothetical protein
MTYPHCGVGSTKNCLRGMNGWDIVMDGIVVRDEKVY